jgi:hypothetical protein
MAPVRARATPAAMMQIRIDAPSLLREGNGSLFHPLDGL